MIINNNKWQDPCWSQKSSLLGHCCYVGGEDFSFRIRKQSWERSWNCKNKHWASLHHLLLFGTQSKLPATTQAAESCIIITIILYLTTRMVNGSHGLMRTYYTNSNTIYQMNWTRLRIPNGRRQTTWTCTSTAKKLKKRPPATNPAGGQSGTRIWDCQISSIAP